MSDDFICPICQESTDLPKFRLPECSHEFHTECIVHWFRQGERRCPMCNNEGHTSQQEVNNIPEIYVSSYYGSRSKVQFLKKYARRRNCDPLLKEYIEKLKKLTEKLKTIKKEESEFKNNFNGNFKELKKKESSIRQKMRRVGGQIRVLEREMCNFPISQLIVVRKVTLMDD